MGLSSFMPWRRMSALVDAMSRSQAVIEFGIDGRILNANENFLRTMGYTLAQIRGKHHSMFVEPGFADTAEYREFWQQLKQGAFSSAEYKRVTRDGDEVWLQATYNPVRGIGGRTTKVVKFATDVTAAKLQAAEHAGMIAAIGRSQGIISFALDGTILDANDNFLTAIGYTLDEIKGQPHAMLVLPEERHSAEYQQFWQALRRGEFRSGEFLRLGKGGREIWIQATYNPILDMSGKPFKVVKFAIDVTQQKLASLDAQGKLAAIDRAQGVIEFGLDGTILTANANFLAVIGYELEEVRGRNHSMLVDAATRGSPEYAQLWSRLRAGEFQSARFRRVGKNGREVWIQATYNPILDSRGKPFKVVKFATDITEEVRRNAQFAVLSLVADNTDNSVVITDRAGIIEYVNPGFTRLTEYTAEEAIGRKPGTLLQGKHSNPATIARIREKLRAGKPFYDEVMNYSKARKPYWISLSINPVFNAQGQLERFVSVQANITSSKLEALDHELRMKAIETSNAVLEWNEHGVLARLNDVAERLLNADVRTAQERIPSLGFEQMFDTTERQSLEGGHAFSKEVRIERADGECVYFSATVLPLRELEGGLRRVVLYAQDVSARRRAIRETERAMTDVLDQISKVARDISGLSQRTNLVALNATIEAARAGEAGRGFAVVASEVKGLASRSSGSTSRITGLVAETQRKIQELIAD